MILSNSLFRRYMLFPQTINHVYLKPMDNLKEYLTSPSCFSWFCISCNFDMKLAFPPFSSNWYWKNLCCLMWRLVSDFCSYTSATSPPQHCTLVSELSLPLIFWLRSELVPPCFVIPKKYSHFLSAFLFFLRRLLVTIDYAIELSFGIDIHSNFAAPEV